MVEAKKKKSDQQDDPSAIPLDRNKDLFLGLWLYLYKLYCAMSDDHVRILEVLQDLIGSCVSSGGEKPFKVF